MKKVIVLCTLLIAVSTVFLGIGYATVDNITLELSGDTSIKKSDSLHITSVEYKSDEGANLDQSKINSFNSTTINSKIVLGNDVNSTITYEVIIENTTSNTYKYIDTVYNNSSEFYDNDNIEYEVEGIKKGEKLLPDSEKTIQLTFKYKDAPIDNNVLNSYINIKFAKVYNIEYVNIEDSNLIDSIGENESKNIEFTKAPDSVEVTGDLDYEYNNGVLSISNVKSNIKIIGKEKTDSEGIVLYSTGVHSAEIGSTIDPSDFKETNEEIEGTYMKYTVDSNNKIIKIEACKTGTKNAKEVCLIGADSDKYDSNKEIIISYFGGNINNIPKECSEDDNSGVMEFTCNNSYVLLATDDEGGIFISDIENNKSCVINSVFGIYSCK